jgi:protein-S-isoprenylcysteine O-methyltransferase Ste14
MTAIEPEPMSRGAAIAYAIGLPLGLLVLVFLPAGTWRWMPGWIFVAFLVAAYGVSALVLLRVNPAIYRARSRVQPGTRRWDRILLVLMLPAMVAEIPLATLDAGRMGWSRVPGAVVVLGYALLAAGIALGAWPQAVNRFFEPGVRLQREREQSVITTGPYAFVRHPGYLAALLTFAGIPLALASWWALLPAVWASAVLILRTRWEDALLHAELQGYADYAARVRYRLVPGLW